ncbi:MAG: exo-alpha-sialidase [Planctomycetes bacterium]|nr:exo-alpha-sialidase [Planctomycetota bacterium]
MKQLLIICLSVLVLGTLPASPGERGPATLAQDYSVVARSEDPKHVFLGTPAIARLPSGRYVVTYDRFRNDCEGCIVVTSDDRGRTWTERTRVALQWASPFVIEQSLFLIGNNQKRDARDIAIARSDNGGQTWSPVRVLFQGRYTGAATSVLVHGGRLWRAFETCPPGNENWKSVVVAADLNKDLLNPASWRISNEVAYPGTPPALTQGLFRDPRIKKANDGWLEGNIIERNGRLFVLPRVRMQFQTTANMTALLEVANDGNQLALRFLQFYPMPGGQNKFHILRDPQTGLYWTSVTRVTDSFRDVEPLLAMRFKGTGGNERRVQVLMYSADALNWFDAGFVAFSPSLMEAFSYAWLMIDGEDLVVMCRTSQGGLNNHDTNLITLHRIRDFRQLVPEGLFAPNAVSKP